jgi:hypothetical protein
MLRALSRALRYRDLVEEHRRLGAICLSTEMRNRYLRIAEHYAALAEAEEELALAYADGN